MICFSTVQSFSGLRNRPRFFQHPFTVSAVSPRAAEPIGGIATLRLGGPGDSLAARLTASGASWSGKNDPLGSSDHVFL